MTDSVSNETPGQTILILVDHRLTGGFVPSTHDTPDTAQIATFGNVNQALTRPLTCANALTHRHCPGLGRCDLSKVHITQIEEHLSGEEGYRVLSPCSR